MRLSRLNIKKINLKDIDNNYSGQDILMKLGELYQFESGIFGYGNIWNKLQRKVEDIITEELDKVLSILGPSTLTGSNINTLITTTANIIST